jgi:hypothetical protein
VSWKKKFIRERARNGKVRGKVNTKEREGNYFVN